MPISVKCTDCGKSLRAPDALAGKKAKCPDCGATVPIPSAAIDAEEISDEPASKPLSKSQAKSKPAEDENESDFDDAEDEQADGSDDEGTKRKACPMCGEMIVASAAKCRFCGETLDPELRKRGKKRAGGRGKEAPEDLRAIAKYQKGVLLCILVELLALGLQVAAPQQLRPLFGIGYLVASLVATVFVFLLAMKVYSTGMGVFWGILTLIPCLGLLVLLIVNSKATGVLKENGISVGLLGAKLSDI
ncbi:MAG: hypothetical protein IAG10_01630 [Planctomycetaceae bacterium]|nr:hypothetical protein [Planctomycetaceae bacterium]